SIGAFCVLCAPVLPRDRCQRDERNDGASQGYANRCRHEMLGSITSAVVHDDARAAINRPKGACSTFPARLLDAVLRGALQSCAMATPSFLQRELNRRRARNPRYSLRAFANALGTHHSTLSQMMQARRRLTTRTIRRFGQRLGLSAPEIRDACV